MSEKCIRGWDESISGSKTMWKRELSFRRRRVEDRSKRTSIYHSTGLLGRCCLVGAFLSIVSSVSVAQDNSAVGQWSPVMTWPYKAIHAHLLPTGNVLFWPKADQAQLGTPPLTRSPLLPRRAQTSSVPGTRFCPTAVFWLAVDTSLIT